MNTELNHESLKDACYKMTRIRLQEMVEYCQKDLDQLMDPGKTIETVEIYLCYAREYEAEYRRLKRDKE